MQKFLCVYVSLRRIALLYNSDDCASTLSTFRPESATPANGVVPFAAFIQNGTIMTGTEFAYDESLKKAPGALFELFSLSNSDVEGLNMPVAEIPAIALKAYLANSVSEVYSVDIDSEKSELPVLLVFTTDVDPVWRNSMVDWFRRDGFSNISMISFESELLANFQMSTDFACTVISDGNDVTSSLFIRQSKDLLAANVMAGVGTDPRVKIGSNLLWKSLDNTGYLTFEHELPILQKCVADFINSDKPLYDKELELSDEKMHAAYLDRSEIERQANSASALAPNFRAFLAKEQIKPQNVTLLLCESSDSVSLLESTFSKEYSELINVSGKQWLNIFTNIWRSAVRVEYKMSSLVVRKPANSVAIRKWVTEKNTFVDTLSRVQDDIVSATSYISRAITEQLRVENEWKERIKGGDFIGARALIESAVSTDVKVQASALTKALNTLEEFARFVDDVNDVEDANEQIERYSRLSSEIKEAKSKAEKIQGFRSSLLKQTDEIQSNIPKFKEKIELLRKTSVKAIQDRILGELKELMPGWYPLPTIQISKVNVSIKAEVNSTGILFLKKRKLHVRIDFGPHKVPFRCILALATEQLVQVDRDNANIVELNEKGEELSGVVEREFDLPLPEKKRCVKKGKLIIKLWPHEDEGLNISSVFNNNSCSCEQE